MKKCVILSMDDDSDFEVYDHLLIEPLAAAGWQTETISWRNPSVDWNDFQLVMIRSPWDYQLDEQKFLQVLTNIDNSNAHLDNPLNIVKWNIDKRYLKDLEEKGVLIPKTLWCDDYDLGDLSRYFKTLAVDEIVVKPCVSAGAFDTYRIKSGDINAIEGELCAKFKNRNFMVQPFIDEIIEEGEYSLFYFDGEYSHSILKTPKNGDFRVQEEYGGRLLLVEPEENLVAAAKKVIDSIDTSLLYSRLDFVRTPNGFALMEAELIEPSLYFNLDPNSAQRYVDAVERRMKRKGLIA